MGDDELGPIASRERLPLILAAWKVAHERMTSLAPGAVTHDETTDDVDRLRSEYLRLADGLVPDTLGPDDEVMAIVRRYME